MWQSAQPAFPEKSTLPFAGSPGTAGAAPLPCSNRKCLTVAETVAAPRDAKDGIPPCGIPVIKMCESSSSDFRTSSARVAMSGPRSPPFPSRPWQAAQVDSNVCRPVCDDTRLRLVSCADKQITETQQSAATIPTLPCAMRLAEIIPRPRAAARGRTIDRVINDPRSEEIVK